MTTEHIALAGSAGTRHELEVRRFGTPGARPKIYIQAGLHADEMPGVLTAHHLCGLLDAAEVIGEIVVLPLANPLGLAQRMLGAAIGRFSLADGMNYNRGYPRLWEAAGDALQGRLGSDEAANGELARIALCDAAAALPAVTPEDHLRRALLRLAIDADAVLDLHCDGQACMHLYTLTPNVDAFMPLARLLQVQAVLVADDSGDDPFDEACSRSGPELRRRFPDHPLPPGCVAVTVELRGAADVDDSLAALDAQALLGALRHMGAVAGAAPDLPPALCVPTPLAASEPLVAPVGGVIAYLRTQGDRVMEGDVVAEMVDAASGVRTPVPAPCDGLLFSRRTTRYAPAGNRIGKIAGTRARRTGLLLGA